jgi:serine/threonine protein kinase
MINNYVITGYLGKGAFGVVKHAIKHTNGVDESFALKIFKKSQLRRKREYIKDSTTGCTETIINNSN